MAAEAPPVGFLHLYSLASWRLLDLRICWIMGMSGTLSLALSATIFDGILRILSFALAALFLAVAIYTLLEEFRPLNLIAVNLGHPWIEEEHDVDLAEVAFRISKTNWMVLPVDSGMVRLRGSGELFLIDDEDEGAPLTKFSSEKSGMRTVHWLNIALALRDAQNSAEEDPFESARDREQQESVLLQREWEDTRAGQFDIKPGILFRGLSSASKEEEEP